MVIEPYHFGLILQNNKPGLALYQLYNFFNILGIHFNTILISPKDTFYNFPSLNLINLT